MAASFQVKKNLLPQVRQALRSDTNAVMRGVAQEAAAEAKSLAPKDTGALQDGIKARRNGRAWEVISTEFYGHFHEFGTVKLPPRPFMTPAGERAVGKLKRRMMAMVDGATR